MRHFQGLPVFIRDKAGLHQTAVNNPKCDCEQDKVNIFPKKTCRNKIDAS